MKKTIWEKANDNFILNATNYFVVRNYQGLCEINYLFNSKDLRKFIHPRNSSEWDGFVKSLVAKGEVDWSFAANDTLIVYAIIPGYLEKFLMGKFNTDPIEMVTYNRNPEESVVDTIQRYIEVCSYCLKVSDSSPDVVAQASKSFPELVNDETHKTSFQEVYEALKTSLNYDERMACERFISGYPKAEDLSPEELERAFRIQDHRYMCEDARRFFDEEAEYGNVHPEDITDEVIDAAIADFESECSMDACEYDTWTNVVRDLVRDHLTPPKEDVEKMRVAYDTLVNGNTSKTCLDELFLPVVENGKNYMLNDTRDLRFYRLVKQAYEALNSHDVDGATGFLGEIFSD